MDSVLTQSYKDIEVILVDDGSPDKCPQICDDYSQKDPRVRVIHQENAGIASARNSGIEVANGEYILCIDSDDFLYHKDVLQEIADKTEQNADVVMIGYKKYFDSDGSWGVDVCPHISNGLSVGETIKEMLLNGSYIATAWTKVIRREILIRHGISFRNGMVSGEDVDWFLNVLSYVQRLESVESPCLAYRQRQGSISHSPKKQSLTDFIWILETWPKRIMDRGIEQSLSSVLKNLMGYYWANTMILYSTYGSSYVKQYKTRMKALSGLSEYAISKRALLIRKCYKVLGFDITVSMLKVLGILKKC